MAEELPKQMIERTTLAVFGLFGSPNLGNEATLAAFLHNMRQRTADVVYVCVAPAHYPVEQRHGTCHLPLNPLPAAQYFWRARPQILRETLNAIQTLATEPLRRARAARMLDGVKALFIPGTGIVDDFGQGPLDMPLHLDRWTAAAVSVGARVAFVSIGATRVDSAISRYLFSRSLRRASYCSFRDEPSAQTAGRMGASGTPTVTGDLAFSLPEEIRRNDGIEWPPQTVGVGLMGYYGWNTTEEEGRRIYNTYVEKMAAFVAWLLSLRLTVRLLIGDTRADQRARADVLDALATRGQSAGEVAMAAPIPDYLSLIEEIKRCDLVVGSRFHNVLLSLWLNRPVVSIGYDEKNDALMAEVGLASYCHSIETLDLVNLRSSVGELMSMSKPPTESLNAYVERQRMVLNAQYDELASKLPVV